MKTKIKNPFFPDVIVITEQQKRICDMLVCDASDKEIAAALKISVPTVRSHLNDVRRRLHARSRVGLAIFWVAVCREQLIEEGFTPLYMPAVVAADRRRRQSRHK